MRVAIWLVCTLGLALSPCFIGSASAADTSREDVQRLYEMCNGPRSGPEASFCLGYVAGVHDLMAMNGNSFDKVTRTEFGMCDHGKATYGAAVQAFKNWAEKHPKNWADDMLSGVVIALGATWPCT
jgi:hypothetical protein